MNVLRERLEAYFFGDPPSMGRKILFIKRANRLAEYKQYLSRVHEFGHVWQGITGFLDDEMVSIIVTGIGPGAIGDAVCALNRQDAICLYSGTCGGLTENLTIGDYFVAEQAICGDGFSFHLGHPPLSLVSGSNELVNAVKALLSARVEHVASGLAFTTSTIVREFTLDFWMNVSIEAQAIEMAAAAFYAAAQATGKKAVAYFWVTDLPRREKSFLDTLTPQEVQIKQERYAQTVYLDIELLQHL